MKDYRKMTVKELQREVEMLGEYPYGMTKEVMIDLLMSAESARNMTDAELYAHLVKTGKA